MELKKFKIFISTLKNSIKTWDYFVNWKKVFTNSSELEISLNKLNYLIGKDDLRKEFKTLYADNPDIVKTFPVLLAVRENSVEIYDEDTKTSQMFNFSNNTQTDDEYYEFFEKTGIIHIFKDKKIKNVVDYVLGVEVGLDSNGRKNRGGELMETIVESFIADFCSKNELKYASQVNAKKIKELWNYNVNVDKSSRSFDFAIYNPSNQKIKLVETNFYNGGGSKLKAVCGEFKVLFDELKTQEIDFIWVTDGKGWETTLRPLEETYNHNDYIFNLHMLENNILDTLKW